jgi:hypothetical protein
MNLCWKFSRTGCHGNMENVLSIFKNVPSQKIIAPEKTLTGKCLLNKTENAENFLQGYGTGGDFQKEAVSCLQTLIYPAKLLSCHFSIGNHDWIFIVTKIAVFRPLLPFFIFFLQENVASVCSTHAGCIFVFPNTTKKIYWDVFLKTFSPNIFLNYFQKNPDQCRGTSRLFLEIDRPNFLKTSRNKTPGSNWPIKPRVNFPVLLANPTSPKYFSPPLVELTKNPNKNVNRSFVMNFGGGPLPPSILFIVVPVWSIPLPEASVKELSKTIQGFYLPSLQIIFLSPCQRCVFSLTFSECSDVPLALEGETKAPLRCPFMFSGNSEPWAPQNIIWIITSPTQTQWCVSDVVGHGKFSMKYPSMDLQSSILFFNSFLSKSNVDCRDGVNRTPTSRPPKLTSTSKKVVTHLVFRVSVGDCWSDPYTFKGGGWPQF